MLGEIFIYFLSFCPICKLRSECLVKYLFTSWFSAWFLKTFAIQWIDYNFACRKLLQTDRLNKKSLVELFLARFLVVAYMVRLMWWISWQCFCMFVLSAVSTVRDGCPRPYTWRAWALCRQHLQRILEVLYRVTSWHNDNRKSWLWWSG